MTWNTIEITKLTIGNTYVSGIYITVDLPGYFAMRHFLAAQGIGHGREDQHAAPHEEQHEQDRDPRERVVEGGAADDQGMAGGGQEDVAARPAAHCPLR